MGWKCVFFFCIILIVYTNAQKYKGAYLVDTNSATVIACGPNVLTGDWLIDTKANGLLYIEGMNIPRIANNCFVIGSESSVSLVTDCTNHVVTISSFNNQNCIGSSIGTISLIQGHLCPANFLGNNATAVATIGCMPNFQLDTRAMTQAILLTGNGPDIQISANAKTCASMPTTSTLFSGFLESGSILMTYNNGCYESNTDIGENTSISGSMDCNSGQMAFSLFESPDCSGPSTSLAGTCGNFNIYGSDLGRVNAFCLDPASSSSTPISLGVLIGVPIGAVVLGTGLIVFIRHWRLSRLT